MGRDTSGVKGMNVAGKVGREPNRVLAMDVARDDSELFVVTENGYGKRTAVSEYPVKGRGTKGVLTIKLTEKKGGLAGALIVREHQDLLFISENGMVQRTRAGGISQMGRATQGVRVMNMKARTTGSAPSRSWSSPRARPSPRKPTRSRWRPRRARSPPRVLPLPTPTAQRPTARATNSRRSRPFRRRRRTNAVSSWRSSGSRRRAERGGQRERDDRDWWVAAGCGGTGSAGV